VRRLGWTGSNRFSIILFMETELLRRRELGPSGDAQWGVFEIPERVDAFNFEDFSEQLISYIANKGPWVALDFSNTGFLSFNAIRFISEKADELLGNGGSLAIVGPTEKLKRQISIFATLENVIVAESVERLRR